MKGRADRAAFFYLAKPLPIWRSLFLFGEASSYLAKPLLIWRSLGRPASGRRAGGRGGDDGDIVVRQAGELARPRIGGIAQRHASLRHHVTAQRGVEIAHLAEDQIGLLNQKRRRH